MLPIIVAGSRPAAVALAQKRPFNCNTSVELHRLRHVHVNIAETGRARLPFSSTGLLNPIGSHPLPHAQQPNRHRARRTASVSPPAISSLGGFRTPAPNRGVSGAVRHQPASENLHRIGSWAPFYSDLIFAALMIGHHFSISALWQAPSAFGVCCSHGKISCPRYARRLTAQKHPFQRPLRNRISE